MSAVSSFIDTFVHLKKKPKSLEALALLKRVAAYVKPIMASRGYHVKTLAEFFPTQTNLLGTNYGKGIKISLRLRPHYNDSEFMPFDDIIGTMLHELIHNVFGPHDAKFYALLDDLNIEYDKLIAKGFNGDDGDVLGGRKLSIADAKKASAARALRVAGGTGAEGKRLGGAPVVGTHPTEEVKRRFVEAAQRRAHDAKWCGHGRADDPILVDDEEETMNEDVVLSSSVTPSPAVNLHEDMLQRALDTRSSTETNASAKRQTPEIIEIDSDNDNGGSCISNMNAAVASSSMSDSLRPIAKARKRPLRAGQDISDDYKRMKSRGLLADSLSDHLEKIVPQETLFKKVKTVNTFVPNDRWICTLCTLFNPLTSESCSACGGEKPSQSKFKFRVTQWKCESCGVYNEQIRWMCRKCENIKKSS